MVDKLKFLKGKVKEYIKFNIYTCFCIKNLRKREVIICQNYQR